MSIGYKLKDCLLPARYCCSCGLNVEDLTKSKLEACVIPATEVCCMTATASSFSSANRFCCPEALIAMQPSKTSLKPLYTGDLEILLSRLTSRAVCW